MGATTDMVFRLLALDEASKTFKTVAASADESGAAVEESNDKFGGASPVLLATAAAAAMVALKCIDMGAKFQTGMETLVTGAGESQSALGMVSNGILDMAVKTGTSTTQLTSGMYMIESAGFHGAAGLQVLTAAAEGAKVGQADLGDVGNALTDVLNDYHEPASKAVSVTDQLVATVSAGKMKMSDLAGSLSNVVPLASSAGISFAQVAGAIATMTGHGMSADQATQDLSNTIRSLQAPNAVAVKEMQSLGLNSTNVSMQLGKLGLTGTLSELTTAITSHMGPAGTVLQNAFATSTTAAADAKTMIASMPASLQKLATSFQSGSLTSTQWKADLKNLTPVQAGLMNQFAGVADKTHTFNSLLASGGPAAQTYNDALEKMTGGATGLGTSLMLTGENSATFAGNVAAIGKAGQSTSKDVTGWSTITGTLSFKLDQAREVVETLGIRIGTILLPVAGKLVGSFMDIVHWAGDAATWLGKHKTVAEALAIGIAVMLLPSVISLTVALGTMAIAAIAAAAPFVITTLVIAGLALGFLQLIKHWGDVTAFFGHAVKAVGNFFEDDLVKPISKFFTVDIPAIFKIGEQVFMVLYVDPIKDVITGVIWFVENGLVNPLTQFFTKDIPAAWDTGVRLFKSIFVTPIQTAVNDVKSGFSDAFNAIPKLVSSAFSTLVSIVKMPIDGVIAIVNMAIGALDNIHVSIPSWVPGVGGDGFGISIPKLPMLADGGLVLPQPGGTQVTVAEAGQPEIVSPIPAMQQAMTAALVATGPRGSAGTYAGAGSSPDTPLYLEITVKYPNGQVIDKELVAWQRSGGVLQSVSTAIKTSGLAGTGR